ncbi:MAG: hypothetical protein AAGG46_10780, partial [Planctomycetota bacterium]
RLVALAVASARAPDAANATFAAAPDGSFVFEDWQTWFETAKRLADLVELQGCNAAAITVASSRGPIYPSEVFAATPGADRSPLAHGVVDLPRRDPLALIFREFDRRGLSLIPTIVFDAAVPGVAPSRSMTSELSTPRAVYAAASPSTARIMRRAVVEIVDRYAQHSSFAALAIDLGGGGAWDYSLLQPATDAPIDSQLDDFLASSGVAWPTGVPRSPETIRVALGGPWRAAWSGWRREQLTDMYRSLAKTVRTYRSDLRLHLLTHSLPNAPVVRESFTPSLVRSQTFDDVLNATGLETEALIEEPGLRIVSTSEVVGGRRLSEDATASVAESLAAGAETSPQPNPTMLARRTTRRRLAAPIASARLSGPLPDLVASATPTSGGEQVATLYSTPGGEAVFDGGPAISGLLQPELVERRRRLASEAATTV